jgi:hypothetical protein
VSAKFGTSVQPSLFLPACSAAASCHATRSLEVTGQWRRRSPGRARPDPNLNDRRRGQQRRWGRHQPRRNLLATTFRIVSARAFARPASQGPKSSIVTELPLDMLKEPPICADGGFVAIGILGHADHVALCTESTGSAE